MSKVGRFMKVEHADIRHQSVMAGPSDDNGSSGSVDTEGELVASSQHGGTVRDTAHFPGVQDRDGPYSVRRKTRQNSRKLKWRSVLYVALVGGLLVALARAIKCIRRETEVARTLVGSTSRRLAGGDERECEEFGSIESGASGGATGPGTSSEDSGGRSSQTPLSLPAAGATGSGATGSVGEGENAEGGPSDSAEPESLQAAAGAEDPEELLAAEQFSNIFIAHFRLLASRGHPRRSAERELAMSNLVLETQRVLSSFLSRPSSAARLSEAERRCLDAVQAILGLELDILSQEVPPGAERYFEVMQVALLGIRAIFLRDETAAAVLGGGAETREVGGSTGMPDSEQAAAAGRVATVAGETGLFWGNTVRVLKAIKHFVAGLRALRANEWRLVQGRYTPARAMQTAQLRQELLDNVTVCVSPGTGPLEQRDTSNYLDLYLLGLFRFFLRSELGLSRVFPDGQLEERIWLLSDLVYQLSKDGKVPYPGP